MNLKRDFAEAGKKKLQRNLLRWFRRFQRDLPWRHSKDPYRIWVSEIMLQQTRVAAVIPYYERFLARFPDVRSLAKAPQDEVLRLWSGLGYYSRARNLQRAAQEIVAKHGGEFPRRLEDALELPGIGSYTAAAILSIAYGAQLAALDGNVARVLARLAAVSGDLREPKRWASLQTAADVLLASRAPGEWNEAMMELGATLCTPRAPQCLQCPVSEFCEARKTGVTEKLPEKRGSRARVNVNLSSVVFVDNARRTLLVAPPASNGKARGANHVPSLASRMWHFPTLVVGRQPERELRGFLAKFGGRNIPRANWIAAGTVRHTVTFRDIRVAVWCIPTKNLLAHSGACKTRLGKTFDIPVSNLTRKIAHAATTALAQRSAHLKTRGARALPRTVGGLTFSDSVG